MEELVGDVESPFVAEAEVVGEDVFEGGRGEEDGKGVRISDFDQGEDTDPGADIG